MKPKHIKILGLVILLGAFIFLIIGYSLQKRLIHIYQSRESLVVRDRYGQEVFIQPNQNGYWARYSDESCARFKKLLIQKEDKYFYYHFGFNPWGIFQAFLRYIGIGNRRGCSTISQQLVKVLLGQELERSFKNKFIEAFYTLGLETYQSKDDILRMYLNSVYWGNQAQGLSEASQLYFNLPPDLLTEGQILQLLASVHSPTETNPGRIGNAEIALIFAQILDLNSQEPIITDYLTVQENMENYSHYSNAYFEISPFVVNATNDQELTCDIDLTERIRKIVQRNIGVLESKNVKNGAVVVIKLPKNEILAMIGSPDPASFEQGRQINMLNKPRPIGSTIKPFIYVKAFEKGLRPYTLVDDREYKYITALGFPLYPKNFDYKYRGEVTLHYALSNSLNVPSVKVLEYVGLEDFYHFLEKDLEFQPIQSLNNYQLGIALGSLEMSLYDLSQYFTIFPNNGILKELSIIKNNQAREKEIIKPEYVQLINKILNDRKTGIEQFGLVSELNLPQESYGLKTGTSRDFHDSWVIGYTPDFLVGVWLGNADNTPMEAVSGQAGAGRIWAETMELLFYSEYNKKTPFDFGLLKEFYQEDNLEYGLLQDNYQKHQNLLKEEDAILILDPHDGDVFLLEEHTKIILEAQEVVKWFINQELLGEGKTQIFVPQKPGPYQIRAEDFNGLKEIITIYFQETD